MGKRRNLVIDREEADRFGARLVQDSSSPSLPENHASKSFLRYYWALQKIATAFDCNTGTLMGAFPAYTIESGDLYLLTPAAAEKLEDITGEEASRYNPEKGYKVSPLGLIKLLAQPGAESTDLGEVEDVFFIDYEPTTAEVLPGYSKPEELFLSGRIGCIDHLIEGRRRVVPLSRLPREDEKKVLNALDGASAGDEFGVDLYKIQGKQFHEVA